MAIRFFIPNPADTDFPFSEDWEIAQWVEEAGAAITITRDISDADHPSVMKVVSDTDGKGVALTVDPAQESTKYAFSFTYKVDADQEIDYVVYDNSNAANIVTGTLVESSENWSYHYEEFTTPAGCLEIIIYLRAGDSGGDAFYIDNLKLLGNALEEDPDDYSAPYSKDGTVLRALDGTGHTDVSMVTVDFPLAFPFLTAAGFAKLRELYKTPKETYFDDQNVPSTVQRKQMYIETQYDFTGITKASGPHYAYEDKSVSEPAARTDFETNEIETADYNKLDDDDDNSYQDGASTTGHFVYHKFVFDTSGDYSSADEIQSFEITYKGASNDVAFANQDGVTLYAWNCAAGNWVKLGATRVTTKETISRSLMKPEQAQMFVDTTNNEINILVQTNGTKGVGTALTIDSYYVEVTINKAMNTTVNLLNRAILSDGDVIHVKNLSRFLSLVHGWDYRIGATGESVIADGVNATLGGVEHFLQSNVLNADVNDIQISLWIKTDVAAGGMLIGKNDNVANNTGYALWLRPHHVGGHLAFTMMDVDSDKWTMYGSNYVLDGEWHHVVVVIDRSNRANCETYFDGVQDTGYQSSDAVLLAADESLDNAVNFSVGAESDGGATVEGSFCDVRIQIGGTLWTPTQVLWQVNHRHDYSSKGWSQDGTQAYWEFHDHAGAANGDSDGMITEGSGGGLHLDAVGGTTTNFGTHSRVSSADPGEVLEVKYDQYYRVRAVSFGEVRQPTGTPYAEPPRSAALQLRGLLL